MTNRRPPNDLDLDRIAAELRPKVGFTVRRTLGANNPDWEDVTNEVLAQATAKIRSGEFRGDSSIGTFVYTITVRRVADYLRQKNKVLRHAPEPDPPLDPHAGLELDEDLRRLADAIRALKPKYRDVLRLYYLKECSREETARRLGITPAKVSERVNYAQKLLRKIIAR